MSQKLNSQKQSKIKQPYKQTNLFDYFDRTDLKRRYGRTVHGGAETKHHRKLERPLSTKKWIHLVLKSDKATGKYSFLLPANKIIVEGLLHDKAKKFGIRIGQRANVGNHIHLKIKIPSRENFQKFLKSVTCLIARKLTRASRGNHFGRFWQGLAYTRILMSSLEELNLHGYIKANVIEAEKGPAARRQFLKQFNQWVYRTRTVVKALDSPYRVT